MFLYPLKFVPRLVEKMWGGRKIETVLGKKLPAGKNIGESWEIYDFPPGIVDTSSTRQSSPIANGPLAGRPLHWAVKEFGADLLDQIPLVGPDGQFPLLIKFLDAREDLSVQVHPDENYCAGHPEAHLKSEAWYVLQHDAGSRLFKGLRPGATRETFGAAVEDGAVEQYLAAIPARQDQCHYLPSGTIHALGAGMLVAEVQTPSDTTFRVFDFNRVDPSTGRQRALHVEQAMQCIDFSGRPEDPQPRSPISALKRRVVTSPYFKIERVRCSEGIEEPLAPTEPAIWIMLQGDAQIKLDGIKQPVTLTRGETLLLPAAMKKPVLKTSSECLWLEVTFPH
ncbi:MAG TPA: type I phosphomannose isomerase catalytic subunit [Tepidisphaeraceae bacterium]|jgi:mannose-6-phosphate isomerase|nr:type I phosphomannose isomerase catalytic subunit [Tepidisphaeraceae bacterium]